MTYDEAQQLIMWAIVAIVGIPSVWAAWDWWKHRGDSFGKIRTR